VGQDRQKYGKKEALDLIYVIEATVIHLNQLQVNIIILYYGGMGEICKRSVICKLAKYPFTIGRCVSKSSLTSQLDVLDVWVHIELI
jgi:hypothetical protein